MAAELLERLHAAGLTVASDGAALTVRPKELLTPELRAAIVAGKADLLATLAGNASTTHPQPASGPFPPADAQGPDPSMLARCGPDERGVWPGAIPAAPYVLPAWLYDALYPDDSPGEPSPEWLDGETAEALLALARRQQQELLATARPVALEDASRHPFSFDNPRPTWRCRKCGGDAWRAVPTPAGVYWRCAHCDAARLAAGEPRP